MQHAIRQLLTSDCPGADVTWQIVTEDEHGAERGSVRWWEGSAGPMMGRIIWDYIVPLCIGIVAMLLVAWRVGLLS